jgi:hypothetical protein
MTIFHTFDFKKSNVTYLKYCKNIVTKGKKGKFVTLSGKKVTKVKKVT